MHLRKCSLLLKKKKKTKKENIARENWVQWCFFFVFNSQFCSFILTFGNLWILHISWVLLIEFKKLYTYSRIIVFDREWSLHIHLFLAQSHKWFKIFIVLIKHTNSSLKFSWVYNPQWCSENLECFRCDFCSFSHWLRKTVQKKAAGSIIQMPPSWRKN